MRSRPLHVVVATGGTARLAGRGRRLRAGDAVDLQREARDRLASRGLERVTSHVAEEAAGAALTAASESACMLVVGTRGRSRFSHALGGSVSRDVALHAACTVVVVRQPRDPAADRIVVGVDGLPGSERALGFAFDEASRTDAPLVAIHAFRLQSARAARMSGYRPLTVRDELDAGERVPAETVAGWAEKYPDVDFTAQSVPLHPARALVNASEHAALVVVGPPGPRVLGSPLPRSVGRTVLRHARCSVAIAR